MKPSLLLVAVGWAALLVQVPSGGESSYEDVCKKMLGTVEEINKILKEVKDRSKTPEAARPELKKAAQKMVELRKQAEESKQPDKEERERLKKTYAPKYEAAVKQLNDLVFVIKGLPGGDEAVAELDILKDKSEKEKDKKDLTYYLP